MKKSRFLALALVVAVMLMGAGYAAWTDQLQINTQVKTGHLDLHFVDLTGETELRLANHITGYVTYAQDGTGNNDWDTANVTIENMYPKAQANVTLKMQNNSTLPVEMRQITDTKSTNWQANGVNFEQIGACVQFFAADGTRIMNTGNSQYSNPWEPAHLANVALPVGGYAIIDFTFQGADDMLEDTTFEFNPRVVWQQFNQNPIPPAGNGNLVVVTP